MATNRSELSNRRYRRLRAEMLRDNDTCHICGHLGADVADHDTPVSKGGARIDPANMKPAHGVKGCPTCGRKCNSEKGANATTEVLVTSRDWYRKV